jgi:hypothetical protein
MCAHILASSAHARASALTSAREVFEVNCVAWARLKKKIGREIRKWAKTRSQWFIFRRFQLNPPPWCAAFVRELLDKKLTFDYMGDRN